jgi:hypothetical protein
MTDTTKQWQQNIIYWDKDMLAEFEESGMGLKEFKKSNVVSEPVKERVNVLLFEFNEKRPNDTYYTMSYRTKKEVPIELSPAIKQAIEDILNK